MKSPKCGIYSRIPEISKKWVQNPRLGCGTPKPALCRDYQLVSWFRQAFKNYLIQLNGGAIPCLNSKHAVWGIYTRLATLKFKQSKVHGEPT